MARDDSPITTTLVRQPDGSYAIVARAIFLVPEDADLRDAERMVLDEATRAAHIAASDLVREHLVAC
jgi:hypothetical protein